MQLVPLHLGIHPAGRIEARGGGLYKFNMQLTHGLKAYGFKPLDLKCDILVSKFAFKLHP
jgi:hypothetical protein